MLILLNFLTVVGGGSTNLHVIKSYRTKYTHTYKWVQIKLGKTE